MERKRGGRGWGVGTIQQNTDCVYVFLLRLTVDLKFQSYIDDKMFFLNELTFCSLNYRLK